MIESIIGGLIGSVLFLAWVVKQILRVQVTILEELIKLKNK